MPHDSSHLKHKLRSGVYAVLGADRGKSLLELAGERGAVARERGVAALGRARRVLAGLGIGSSGGAARRRPESAPVDAAPEALEKRKFDLGPRPQERPARQTIPWGYGEDRVTAMPVDPDRLYVYWEVTDEAIAAARERLGERGGSAWLNLRVYDVTGRIFDGTNARSYFDHRVERHDRQWFFTLSRPGTTACVELGLKSDEGYFARIARSGRVDFPRADVAPPGEVEWLTVQSATGDPVESFIAPPPVQPGEAPGGAPPAPDGRAPAGGLALPDGDGFVLPAAADQNEPIVPGTMVRRWDWRAVLPGGWSEIRRTIAWEGEVEETSWEAGPYSYPVGAPAVEILERPAPERVRTFEVAGVAHVVRGPWEVVIRGLSGRASRRVLARWVVHRWWPAEEWTSGEASEVRTALAGASETLSSRRASERRPRGASETWLAGGSEVFYLGASERRLRGASETLYRGASETASRGASERVFAGASEWRERGAARRLAPGASESRLGGASESRLGGASEVRLGGASEVARGGASEVARRDASRAASGDEPEPRPPHW